MLVHRSSTHLLGLFVPVTVYYLYVLNAVHYAPINVMPHYPPYGQHTGHTGGFFKKSVPHIGGFDIPHHRDKLATPTHC